MALHDTIQQMYEEQGLDDLWRWAKGHPNRWNALKEWADNKVGVFARQLEAAREREDRASEALDELAEQAIDLARRIAHNREQLEAAEAARDQERVERLRERREALDTEREQINRRIESTEIKQHKAVLREHNAIKAKKAWIERRLIYRKKWRQSKQQENPVWENFMASGHPLNFSDAAKAEAAIAVVKFDLVVTSTFRATVIPDSNPNSNHGPNVDPGKAVDVAGARMEEYQQDVFDRRVGDAKLLELFGPMNDVAITSGSSLALTRGTFIEELHDTHVHVAASD